MATDAEIRDGHTQAQQSRDAEIDRLRAVLQVIATLNSDIHHLASARGIARDALVKDKDGKN